VVRAVVVVPDDVVPVLEDDVLAVVALVDAAAVVVPEEELLDEVEGLDCVPSTVPTAMNSETASATTRMRRIRTR
jgi:hypothetical protein